MSRSFGKWKVQCMLRLTSEILHRECFLERNPKQVYWYDNWKGIREALICIWVHGSREVHSMHERNKRSLELVYSVLYSDLEIAIGNKPIHNRYCEAQARSQYPWQLLRMQEDYPFDIERLPILPSRLFRHDWSHRWQRLVLSNWRPDLGAFSNRKESTAKLQPRSSHKCEEIQWAYPLHIKAPNQRAETAHLDLLWHEGRNWAHYE